MASHRWANVGPTLAQRRQKSDDDATSSQRWANVGKNLMMMRPVANVGPTSAKSADHPTNSQRRSDGGMLSGYLPSLGGFVFHLDMQCLYFWKNLGQVLQRA